jgi:hypothetical protein
MSYFIYVNTDLNKFKVLCKPISVVVPSFWRGGITGMYNGESQTIPERHVAFYAPFAAANLHNIGHG